MNKDDLRREIDDRTKEWGEHYALPSKSPFFGGISLD
jgi:hypothetical protein